MAKVELNKDAVHRLLNSNNGPVQRILRQVAEDIKLEAGQNIARDSFNSSGELAASIEISETASSSSSLGSSRGTIPSHGWKVAVTAPYGAAVEFGRRAGAAIPPYFPGSRLSRWAGNPRRGAFILAKTISERGIPAKHYFSDAIKTVIARRGGRI